MRVNKRP